MWKVPPVFELTYIHLPSGDHAANQHAASGGPIGRPEEELSIGTRRGSQACTRSISAIRRELIREAYE